MYIVWWKVHICHWLFCLWLVNNYWQGGGGFMPAFLAYCTYFWEKRWCFYMQLTTSAICKPKENGRKAQFMSSLSFIPFKGRAGLSRETIIVQKMEFQSLNLSGWALSGLNSGTETPATVWCAVCTEHPSTRTITQKQILPRHSAPPAWDLISWSQHDLILIILVTFIQTTHHRIDLIVPLCVYKKLNSHHQGGGIHGGAHRAEHGTISGWCSVVYIR